MIEKNVMQITDTATARAKHTLHLSFVGMPVEVSLYSDGPATGQLGKKFSWFFMFSCRCYGGSQFAIWQCMLLMQPSVILKKYNLTINLF
jgi:hypothetical protein